MYLLFYCFVGFSLQDVEIPKLRDLIVVQENYALKDILSSVVALENPFLAADQVVPEKFVYDDEVTSISHLNRANRDLLFQGDMVLTRDHLARIVRESLAPRRKRTAFRDKNYPDTIWKPYVPYIFHSSLSPLAVKSIKAAMNFWQKNTCVKFQKAGSEKTTLVFSSLESGCWSTVGKDSKLKRQVLNIGEGCEHFGITSHELAHALGLFHEQSRYDRDDHVSINIDKLPKDSYNDFAKIGIMMMTPYRQPYDIGSIMHYRPNEFSIDGSATILAKDVSLQNSMGQFFGPSFSDVAKINSHYQCGSLCKKKIQCQNSGFQDSKNCETCVCPSGFGGIFCETIQKSNPARCSGYLNATSTQRRLKVNMKPKSTELKSLRSCYYHIEAPEGQKIEVYVDSVIGRCVQGCYAEGVELKTKKDVRPTGARLCCKIKKPQRYVSEGSRIVVLAHSSDKQTFVQIRYNIFDPNAQFDGSQEDVNSEDVTNDNKIDLADASSSLTNPDSEQTLDKTFRDILLDENLKNNEIE